MQLQTQAVMRFHVDLVNLRWKDSCLGAADYSQMSQSTPQEKQKKTKTAKLLPTQPEWVMYYWCFEDMYRTKIFTWVTHWIAIFGRVFFFFPMEKLVPPRNRPRPASEITIPLERRCCVGREHFLRVLPRLMHKVDGINCLPGVGEQWVCSLTDQQSLQGAVLPLTQ